MSTKIDGSTVYEMFETLISKLDKLLDKLTTNTAEPAQIDLSTINTMAEQLENAIVEIKKPSKVEHRHAISISNSWFSFSWIGLLIIILTFSWIMGNQRQTIVQYRDNDLKYRYIRMQGQTNDESLFRLQQQFQDRDSVRIIRNRVEKFERLVREQAERMERARINEAEVERLRKEIERFQQSEMLKNTLRFIFNKMFLVL